MHQPKQCLDDSNFSFLRCLKSFTPFPDFFFFSENLDDEDRSDLQKRDFNFLSKEIGSAWKRFGRQFNIEDYEIVNITNKSSQVHDRCFNVFMDLKARYGSVKWKPIEMALQKLGLVSAISNYLSRKSTPENV